jgi:hypothetical protein
MKITESKETGYLSAVYPGADTALICSPCTFVSSPSAKLA